MVTDITFQNICRIRDQISDGIVTTPVLDWKTSSGGGVMGGDDQVTLKLELFQNGGSFKIRGALAVMLNASEDDLKNGVVAVSAGNHAIATAYAAKSLGLDASVVMMKSANPARLAACKALGAKVFLAEDVDHAFEMVETIRDEEERLFVHPYEGPYTALGTATLGMELCDQVPDLDAVIVPIGGGGLCAGVSSAVKLLNPRCKVYGVEPEGADNMRRSLIAGSPQKCPRKDTIADSLKPPASAPYSFGLCQAHVDDIVLVSDDDIRKAMARLFSEMKLAVEPAGAASTAALFGPLKERLAGKKVAALVSGSNIDITTFATHVEAAGE